MVDQLLVGLNRFTTAPGVLSLISDIQAWMTKHSAKLAMADLVAVVTKVNANVEEPLDFEHVKQLVQKCGAALPASESHGLRYGFPTFLVVMWGQIVEKAGKFLLKTSLPLPTYQLLIISSLHILAYYLYMKNWTESR